MNTTKASIVLLIVLIMTTAVMSLAQPAPPQAEPTAVTRVAYLNQLGADLEARDAAQRGPLYQRLLNAKTGPQAALNRHPNLQLMGVVRGLPLYYQTANLDAARTVGADDLWPGGATGLDLTGANAVGELALWDSGVVLDTHQEFGGRVSIGDGATVIGAHATHVGGTLVAAGILAQAKGMSPAAYLASYDWNNDLSEMALAAAAGLLVSNHSYTRTTGWYYYCTMDQWYWFGDVTVNEVEDNAFGLYSEEARVWDEIAHAAPNYLICIAAGNARGVGPAPGTEHFYWDPVVEDFVLSTAAREVNGGADGYDCLTSFGNCKNTITVGSVADVPGGWTQTGDVVLSPSSAWGPTDDGRIKPDLVANGIELTSSFADSNDSYASESGTSMATPNVAGSLHLLAQHWRASHGNEAARAATIKGIVIHTASEAGLHDGPDYACGWGLLNAAVAAEVIAADGAGEDLVTEGNLKRDDVNAVEVYSDGGGLLRATLCWSDPATEVQPWELNPTNSVLVNDLDLRIERLSDSLEYEPWILDPANPANAATTGDNMRDNVEQVEIPAPEAGLYRVLVSHKIPLSAARVDYSLVVSSEGAAARPPVVSNVAFSQRTDGSGLVDVSYDLVDADSAWLTVTLEASADGGLSWNLVTASVSGDIGAAVAPGLGRAIVWDFAADNPDVYSANTVVRVWASD